MTTRSLARRTAALALVALVPLAAAACGGDDDDERRPTPPRPPTRAPRPPRPRTKPAAARASTRPTLDEAAVAEAWTTVFDSTVTADAKAPFLEDPTAAAPTLAAYATTGEMMQGITLEPSDVTIDGDTATVTYDILFAGTAAYEDQTGEVANVDGTWKITTEQFCSFMATARTPCADAILGGPAAGGD